MLMLSIVIVNDSSDSSISWTLHGWRTYDLC